MYEYMSLVNGNPAEGLTRDELREVVEAFHVHTRWSNARSAACMSRSRADGAAGDAR
jgi:hypothetical protein